MEASASIEIAKHTLVSCGLILAIGTITGLLAQKIKIPDVAVFLIVGMLIGPEALGLINIKADSALNQIILLFGASYILFDGGASLRFSILKHVWITIVALATVGVVVTAAITGLAAYYVLGVPLMVALLLGSTLASTDPATLVPIFRQVKIRDRVAQTVVSVSANVTPQKSTLILPARTRLSASASSRGTPSASSSRRGKVPWRVTS